jgi:DNA-binding FadR family transcriptional regulator
VSDRQSGEDAHGSSRVVEVARGMARLIIWGEWDVDDAVTLDMVMAKLDVGRPLARAATHQLISKRLLRPRQRVGAIVQARASWDHLDSDLLDWLYEFDTRGALRLITEVREAVEPVAARYAAKRIPIHLCTRLTDLASRLFILGDVDSATFDRHRDVFGGVDEQLHRLSLEASGNPVFAAYADATATALDHRLRTLPPANQPDSSGTASHFPGAPETIALLMHIGLATAIVEGHPDAAEAMSRGLLAEFNGSIEAPIVRAGIVQAVRQIPWRPEHWQLWRATTPELLPADAPDPGPTL